jgi:hypothetical protein
MLNIFDFMGAPPGGLDAMARQFGLSQAQAQRAMEALMPAFALGFQRAAADPQAFTNLMNMFAAGQPTSSNEGAPQGQAQLQGDAALGQLFGSPELTRRVAEQAAHWSGIGAQVLQQMMPIFAAALVSALSKYSEIMRAEAARTSRDSTAKAYALGAETSKTGAETPTPADPFAAWSEIMRTMAAACAARPAEAEEPAPEPPPDAGKPAPESSPEALGEAWSKAIEQGREAQAKYLTSLQNMFDQFWGAPPGRR